MYVIILRYVGVIPVMLNVFPIENSPQNVPLSEASHGAGGGGGVRKRSRRVS